MPRILSDTEWWDRVAKVKSHTVLRETMAYCYLLRRIQRPEACISEATMRNILEAKLGNTLYTAYEIEDLMRVNVPYFYLILERGIYTKGMGKSILISFLSQE